MNRIIHPFIRRFLPLLVGLLLTAGCSHDLLVTPDSKTEKSIEETFNSRGEAYLRLQLRIPDMGSASRAGENANGTDDESLISSTNSYIVLFSSSEGPAKARARSVYPLSGLTMGNPESDGTEITRRGTVTLGISKAGIREGESLYALAIINAPLKGSNQTFYFTYSRPPLGPDGARNPKDARLGVVFYNGVNRTERDIVDNSVNDGENNSTFDQMMNMFVSYSPSAGPYQPRGGETDPHPLISKLDEQGARRYILMTNAPLFYRVPTAETMEDFSLRGDGSYTLVPISLDRLYKTGEEAANAANPPAATIYLERCLAKVTVETNTTQENTAGTYTTEDGQTAAYGFELLGWQLLNAARTSYCGHNLNIPLESGVADMDYTSVPLLHPQGYAIHWITYTTNGFSTPVFRFVSSRPIQTGNNQDTPRYRIHWEISPGYTSDKNNLLFTGSTDLPTYLRSEAGPSQALYPLTNTFEVENMKQKTTTGAIFRMRITAPLHPEVDQEIRDYGIFSLSAEPGKYLTFQQMLDRYFDMLCTPQNLQLLAADIAEPGSGLSPETTGWIENWKFLFRHFYLENPALRTLPDASYARQSLNRFLGQTHFDFFPQDGFSGTINGVQWLKTDTEIPTERLNYYLTSSEAWGRDFIHTQRTYSYPGYTNHEGSGFNDAYVIIRAYLTNSIEYLKTAANVPLVTYYRGGITFYRTLIRHFNDAQTPWNQEETPKVFSPVGGIPTVTPYPISEGENRQGANYLGRYAIVRNTWYRLYIDGMNGTGSITPEPFTSAKTDDDVEQNLYLRMAVAPWVRPALQNISF